MITVVIIGILLAIAILQFSHMIDHSKDATTLGNLGIMRAAVSMYYADHQAYPAFTPPLDEKGGYGNLLNCLVPTYLEAIPNTTLSGNHHPDGNPVYIVWDMAGNEDDAGIGWGQGWKYDGNPYDPDFGKVKLLCTHKDWKGVNWSTY